MFSTPCMTRDPVASRAGKGIIRNHDGTSKVTCRREQLIAISVACPTSTQTQMPTPEALQNNTHAVPNVIPNYSLTLHFRPDFQRTSRQRPSNPVAQPATECSVLSCPGSKAQNSNLSAEVLREQVSIFLTWMSVSLRNSSSPSADASHRTTLVIVASNLSFAATTEGEPSNCAATTGKFRGRPWTCENAYTQLSCLLKMISAHLCFQ